MNATLHMENSVFPRRHHRQAGSEKLKRPLTSGQAAISSKSGISIDEECERGPLVSKVDHSTAITMTSRSNITFSSDTKEAGNKELACKEAVVRNGQQPTQV